MLFSEGKFYEKGKFVENIIWHTHIILLSHVFDRKTVVGLFILGMRLASVSTEISPSHLKTDLIQIGS